MRLLVLGGGPAGLNAALQGRELGAQVTLIESDRLGGTTINRGPAPVRTLVGAARLVRDTQAWPAFGLRGPAPKVDLAARLANAGRVADSAHTWASTRPRSSRSRPVAVAANLRVEQLAELRLAFPTFTEAPGYGRPAAGPRAGGGPPAAFAERSCPSVPARRKSP